MNQPLRNPLLGKFDQDPGRWRPYKYGCVVEVPVTINLSGENTIEIMNQPFIMILLTHAIIGNTDDPETSGLRQDGQYLIEWREEVSNYQNQPLLAETAFGSTRYGAIPFYQPIPFAGNKTLHFRVTNAYNRILSPQADIYRVQIVIHGVADWGTDRRPT